MAIHRFFAYVAGQDPRHAELCRRALDIPLKKTTSNSMTCLNQDEVKTLLAVPSARHRPGLRDRALLTLLCNTGARATEIVQLNIKDLRPDTPIQVRILGKGRKERVCPLWQETAVRARADLVSGQTAPSQTRRCPQRGRQAYHPLRRRDDPRDQRAAAAATNLASLAAKPVSPHTLRHTPPPRTYSSPASSST